MNESEILAYIDDRYEEADRLATFAGVAHDALRRLAQSAPETQDGLRTEPVYGMALTLLAAVRDGKLVVKGQRGPGNRPDVEKDFRIAMCALMLGFERGLSKSAAAEAIAQALSNAGRKPGSKKGVHEAIKRGSAHMARVRIRIDA